MLRANTEGMRIPSASPVTSAAARRCHSSIRSENTSSATITERSAIAVSAAATAMLRENRSATRPPTTPNDRSPMPTTPDEAPTQNAESVPANVSQPCTMPCIT